MGKRKRGIVWSLRNRLEDLNFVGDMSTSSKTKRHKTGKLKRLQEEAKTTGLCISIKNTEERRVNSQI